VTALTAATARPTAFERLLNSPSSPVTPRFLRVVVVQCPSLGRTVEGVVIDVLEAHIGVAVMTRTL
jgi:hypothetical protein